MTIYLQCTSCGTNTTPEMAALRNFNTGVCAVCGGMFRALHVPDPRPPLSPSGCNNSGAGYHGHCNRGTPQCDIKHSLRCTCGCLYFFPVVQPGGKMVDRMACAKCRTVYEWSAATDFWENQRYSL